MIFSKKAYIVYILTLVLLMIVSYFTLDIRVAHFFLADANTYEPIGDFISIFGESHWYIGTAVLGYFFFKFYKKNELYQQRFLFLLYINLFSGIISLFSKWIFGRIRPWGMRNGNEDYGFLLFQNWDMSFIEKMKYHFTTLADAPTTYSSFPSGHTTTVFTAFTFLVILFPRYIYIWLSFAIVLSCSRILANDHFVSDIFAGILVGTLSTIFLYSKLRKKIEKLS
ncbi:phosphatase, PAP2 family [Sulfurimonas gotlandica GD1]|uniref:Phosphatase, PAP2 family n=1 Tax=Sulfurimonas gotlandica (strain DSM 19862 / JCM 16533 / GD1) TaxID=929558 RepID=B6BJT5_SULGG|nr:phosphatase PAP2 family protein [Sulfurimonas gotlandica]EDZ62753.1 membrane-associated phospholipid phosphatase, putative [Sulfurimonas gotlandica GD1]EHP31335.1 phosphatase, PAP2 family [Sulfurimonas gotlandica GD1]